jgi:Fic family protein
MSYISLEKVFYKNRDGYEQELTKRLESYGTVKTNLFISPFSKVTECRDYTKSYNLFVVNNNELLMRQEEIKSNSYKINRLLLSLPEIAKESYVIGTMIDEILSTNEIEGVRSTRKEIQDAMDSRESGSKKRFSGIVRMYTDLYIKDFDPITSLEDIRKIYDEIAKDEIDVNSQLDGELFRKNPVSITHNNKIIHRGNSDEESICKDLISYIDFINNTDIQSLIRIMVGHYFFEYIHPFYDGNGRTGRYIACKYLSQDLDPLTALSFSYMINNKKDKYYEAFEITSIPKNCGEATMFVYMMLGIVIDGQVSLLSKLTESEMLLSKVEEINESRDDLSDDEKKILYLIAQSTFFKGTLEDRQITKLVGKSYSTTKLKIDNLRKKGLIETVKGRPKRHQLSKKLLNYVNR